jgi:hypothetical protein
VFVERELHPRKQNWQIFSTEEGIEIDESDEQNTNWKLENPSLSTHERLSQDSVLIVERVLQKSK